MNIPDFIGRFKIEEELGKGSQGVVYLATDQHLERKVAIKTLHMHLSDDSDRKIRLLKEARTVSKLQHPNIIPVYDAGEYEDRPYLVFEYVDGISLKDYIKKRGILAVHKAVRVMIQLLEGIGCAHRAEIIHRDLSPNNIMIGGNDMPRIMDFGISIMTSAQDPRDSDLSGTPCYMSPEHFSKEPLGPQSDIFSLGLVFYEMLVGHPAIEADNNFAVMYKIANEPVERVSLKNETVDKDLDKIILKALEIEKGNRYSRAEDIKQDLQKYLYEKSDKEDSSGDDKGGHSTLEFLLRKIRHRSDFPSFSKHVTEINQKASVSLANYSTASELANAILKDFSLTSKLLRLVNSSFYGQFSGKITTVSRAVVILGFEQVKMAASSILLFEHLKNQSQSEELQDAALGSFTSGVLAQELAVQIGFEEYEEAFISSMLHNLGRYLVMFYFPEEGRQIKDLMEQKGIDEKNAVRTILGISYEDLGIGVANKWNFPARILCGMQELPKGRLDRPLTEEDTLRNLAGFSNELCGAAGGKGGDKAIKGLIDRYSTSLGIKKVHLPGLLGTAKKRIEEYSEALKLDLKKSRFMAQVGNYAQTGHFSGANEKAAQRSRENSMDPDIAKLSKDPKQASRPETNEIEIKDTLPEIEEADIKETGGSHIMLINGIQEITNILLEEYDFNDVLNMILETMYRGFGFNRVFLCLRNNVKRRVKAVYGFGKDADKVIRKFHFKTGSYSDVFNLAIAKGKDLGINNAHDPRIKKGIPEWYLKSISAPAFVLYPLIINQRTLGLIYADRESKGPVLKGEELNYMKTLSNQASFVMQQRVFKT